MAAELRVQPNNQILLANTVWLSKKTWNRFSKLVAKGSSKTARWKLFLEEASAVRWGSSSTSKLDEKEAAGTADDEEVADTSFDGGKSLDETTLASAGASAGQASASGVKELLAYDGILCEHSKVGKPKSAFLVPREMLEEVLNCARKKEEAYKALWGSCRGMQKFRTGHREQRLVGSEEVCEACCPEWATHFANVNKTARSCLHKSIETCQLFFKSTGTPQTLEVPWEDGMTITGSWLRKLACAQVESEIGDLYVGTGKEQRLLLDDDVMDFLPAILRAHTRSEPPPEPEGDAFLRSIFLTGRR